MICIQFHFGRQYIDVRISDDEQDQLLNNFAANMGKNCLSYPIIINQPTNGEVVQARLVGITNE
jgi:disulfide oxidoreductase YuzD